MNASGKTTTCAPFAAASPTRRTAFSTHACASKGAAPACTTAARTVAAVIARLPDFPLRSCANLHVVADADRARLCHEPVHAEHQPEGRMLPIRRERRERLGPLQLAARLVRHGHLAPPARLRRAERGAADRDARPLVLRVCRRAV